MTLVRHAGDIPAQYNDLTYFISPTAGRTGVALMRLAGFGDEYLSSQYENGGDGAAFEKELTYIPSTTTGGPEGFKIPQPYRHPVELNTDIADYGDDEDVYRVHWLTENHRDADDYSRIIDLNQAFGLTGAALDAATSEIMDVDQWLRAFTVPRILGNRDFYSQPGGPPGSWNHNLIVYVRPSDDKVLALLWDIDESYQEPINGSIIGVVNWAKVAQLPGNLRKYYAHYHDLISSTFNDVYMTYWVNHYSGLAPGVDFNGPKSYIVNRGNYILSQLPVEIPFEIVTNGGVDFATDESSVVLQGNAWYRVYDLYLAGRPEPLDVTWIDADTWQVAVPLHHGANTLTFQGFDLWGNLTGEDSIAVSTTAGVPPQEALRVDEIMYNPAGDDAAEFIEIVNVNGQSVDLAGVRFAAGIDFAFTSGSLASGERIVVARDPAAFAAAYPWATNVVGPFSGGTQLANDGETITLVDGAGELIQSFAYDDAWYGETDGGGRSLVRRDPAGPLHDWNVASGWRASRESHSPGERDLFAGDADGNDRVDLADLAIVQRMLGTPAGATRSEGDLNRDGAVTRNDVALLALNYGRYDPDQAPLAAAAAATLVQRPRVGGAEANRLAAGRRTTVKRRNAAEVDGLLGDPTAMIAISSALKAKRTKTTLRGPRPMAGNHDVAHLVPCKNSSNE